MAYMNVFCALVAALHAHRIGGTLISTWDLLFCYRCVSVGRL